MKELKKRRDPDLMDNPDWIPGIYNYCDRWCERCAFTGKCRSFAMEIRESGVEANAQPEPDTLAHDIRSKEFWEELGITLNLTMEYLRKLELNEGDELITGGVAGSSTATRAPGLGGATPRGR